MNVLVCISIKFMQKQIKDTFSQLFFYLLFISKGSLFSFSGTTDHVTLSSFKPPFSEDGDKMGQFILSSHLLVISEAYHLCTKITINQ